MRGFILFALGVWIGGALVFFLVQRPELETIQGAAEGTAFESPVKIRPKAVVLEQQQQQPAMLVDAAAGVAAMPAAVPSCEAQRSALFKRLDSRNSLPDLLNALALNGEGAEIGVNEGEFAEFFMSRWPCRAYHLVDPWTEQDKNVYDDKNNQPQAVQDSKLAIVRARLAQFGERAVFHRTYSTIAAGQIADASLDFVYIDARHDYNGVLEDLLAWWPKLKVGGVLAGHDFVPDGQKQVWPSPRVL